MSLLEPDSSSTFDCSSWLTVCSSSFIDCISSFDVVSSSLVLWSSSLVLWSSSLVDFSSSCDVCISSRVVWSSSRACCSSRCRSAMRAVTAAFCGAFPSGAAPAGGRVGEDDQHGPAELARLGEPLHRQVDGLRRAVGHHLGGPRGDRAVLAERRRERARQLVAQPLARHGEDVEVGLADRGLEVLPRAPADVEDVALVVGEDHGRGEALDDRAIGQDGQVRRRRTARLEGLDRLRRHALGHRGGDRGRETRRPERPRCSGAGGRGGSWRPGARRATRTCRPSRRCRGAGCRRGSGL